VTRSSTSEAAPAAEPLDEVPSATRHRSLVGSIAPAGWYDRLLTAHERAAEGAEAAAIAGPVLDALADVLPELSFAACVPGGARAGEAAAVVRRGPLAPARAGEGRLFPGATEEHVFALDDGAGATLHAARCGAPGEALESELRFVAHAARLLGGALRRARLADRASAQERELRGVREQLVQSEKLASLGEIAAGIVHELNNPLSAIAAYSEYLWRKAERGAGPAADDLQRLRRIHEAADRLLRFSRELVAYARPSTGEAAPVGVHDVVEQAVGFCEHALAASNARVTREFAERLPAVSGVAAELIQVFVNLITNACHAMPEGGGGELHIRTSLERGAVCVALADNGHGIDPALLPRVFDPFFTTKRAGQGSGLGLSIVRHIVARHGGHVSVDSEPGRGTRFCVKLPARESPEGGAGAGGGPKPAGGAAG
jgi:signal transduction histidine kinase